MFDLLIGLALAILLSRTLLKATILIRRAGLCQRMPEDPESFARAMNCLCLEMTNTRRKADAKKARKSVFRRNLCASKDSRGGKREGTLLARLEGPRPIETARLRDRAVHNRDHLGGAETFSKHRHRLWCAYVDGAWCAWAVRFGKDAKGGPNFDHIAFGPRTNRLCERRHRNREGKEHELHAVRESA